MPFHEFNENLQAWKEAQENKDNLDESKDIKSILLKAKSIYMSLLLQGRWLPKPSSQTRTNSTTKTTADIAVLTDTVNKLAKRISSKTNSGDKQATGKRLTGMTKRIIPVL